MDEYTVTNPPPEGSDEVGKWAWAMFDQARCEKERLKLPERWKYNHKLYRGDPWGGVARKDYSKHRVAANLFFANVQRTVANITARKPVVEAVDLEGYADGMDKSLTARLIKWWKDGEQQQKLKTTAIKMEKYGVTVEKPYWNGNECGISIIDPYAYFPCPGYWEDVARDALYIAFGMPEEVSVIKEFYLCDEHIEPDDTYSLLGEDREENRPVTSGTIAGSGNASGNYEETMHPSGKYERYTSGKALVVELWVRDKGDKYPDGVRVITVTSSGKIVLDDRPNPNINHKMLEKAKLSHAWGRFPVYTANSYESTVDNWGFSAAEQVGDLAKKINELLTRLVAYASRCMFPPLVIPPNSGITKDKINNKPNLVLFPNSMAAAERIRFIPVPPIPREIFNVFDILLSLHDRVYSIEDADRGNVPGGVKAASAIIALQERNAVLIQFKINACDKLIENRGKWAISSWQNFGAREEKIDVNGDQVLFQGLSLAGRRFAFVVESGSTMPRTKLQIEEQSLDLYQLGAIDRKALLQNMNYPGWKEIVERASEGQVGQAIQLLIDAGLPEEAAQQIHQYVMMNQGGPGDKRRKPRTEAEQKELPKA